MPTIPHIVYQLGGGYVYMWMLIHGLAVRRGFKMEEGKEGVPKHDTPLFLSSNPN